MKGLTPAAWDGLERARREGRLTEGPGVRMPPADELRDAAEIQPAPAGPTKETEAAFTDRVIQEARKAGWRVAHFRPARTADGWRTAVSGDGKGFVDLVLVRERVLWAELKTATGRVRADQKKWLLALKAARQEVYLWRPTDWREIVRTLR